MRVLIIEDDPKVAGAVRSGLAGEGYEVVVSRTGEDGFFRATTEPYDLILLDLGLPGRGGLEILAGLRGRGLLLPVLVLTARDTVEVRVVGLDTGADDYLVKPFALKELEIRLDALKRRSTNAVAPRVLKVADLEFDPDTQVVRRSGTRLDLNPSLRTLLALLMTNTHRVVRRDELEAALWGEDRPDGDVLRAHIYALRSIVDKPFARKLLHTVHGTGYRLSASNE
jgi:DNA-binding response OmpR family regulator